MPGLATAVGLLASLEGKPGSTALFMLAVAVVTAVAGIWWGLVAAVVSYVPLSYFFLSPVDAFGFNGSALVASFIFAVAALLVALLLERERRARSIADRATRERDSLIEDLHKTESRAAEALQSTATGVWEWDVVLDSVQWSDNLGPLHGLEQGASPPAYDEYLELVHPEDRPVLMRAVEAVLSGADGYELEFRGLRPDGSERWLWTRASAVRNERGELVRLVGITRDVDDRRREEDRQRLLARSTEILLSSHEHELALAELAREAVGLVGDRCSIELVDDEGALVEVASVPARAAPADLTRHALETGTAELHLGLSGDALERPTIGSGLGGGVQRSAVVAPLISRSRPIGVLALGSSGSYGKRDLDFARELARRAALAVDNARLERSEQRSRHAADEARLIALALHRVTSGLAVAATVGDVARVLIDEGVDALGADAGLAYVVANDGVLALEARLGAESDLLEDWQHVLADSAHPAAAALAERRIVALASQPESDDAHSEIRPALTALGFAACLAVPMLLQDGAAVGVLLFLFTTPRQFEVAQQDLIQTTARQGAQALERARLYEEERVARDSLERTLQAAPRLDGETSPEVAEAICREAVAQFGPDVALVWDVESDGFRVLARASERDDPSPYKVAVPLADFPYLREAIARARPMFVADIQTVAAGAALEYVSEMGIRSVLGVPIVVTGQARRLLVFQWFTVVSEPTPGMLVAIRGFADQAGLALERIGRLEAQREAERSAAETTRVNDRLRRLEEIVRIGLATGSLDDLLEQILHRVRDLLAADRAAILLVDGDRDELQMRAAVGVDPEQARLIRVPVGQGIAGR